MSNTELNVQDQQIANDQARIDLMNSLVELYSAGHHGPVINGVIPAAFVYEYEQRKRTGEEPIAIIRDFEARGITLRPQEPRPVENQPKKKSNLFGKGLVVVGIIAALLVFYTRNA
jgi:hypothetical protein